MIQGARRAADEAKADAIRADAAMTDGTTTPSEQATLAEAAETAWAWAAAMEDVAAYLEAPPDEREERKPPMDRAYAEYIAAAARAATGNYAEAVVAWARALPEHGLAARENAEGANAATEADARAPAKRFRPSARPECFMGTLMPADDNGKRHMRPSLELTEAQRRAAATLPPDMPVPDERDMRRDPRVAWKDDWHMWNDRAQQGSAARHTSARRGECNTRGGCCTNQRGGKAPAPDASGTGTDETRMRRGGARHGRGTRGPRERGTGGGDCTESGSCRHHKVPMGSASAGRAGGHLHNARRARRRRDSATQSSATPREGACEADGGSGNAKRGATRSQRRRYRSTHRATHKTQQTADDRRRAKRAQIGLHGTGDTAPVSVSATTTGRA